MKSRASVRYWECFHLLPKHTQQLAHKSFELWVENPRHPSLRFKEVKPGVWSVIYG